MYTARVLPPIDAGLNTHGLARVRRCPAPSRKPLSLARCLQICQTSTCWSRFHRMQWSLDSHILVCFRSQCKSGTRPKRPTGENGKIIPV